VCVGVACHSGAPCREQECWLNFYQPQLAASAPCSYPIRLPSMALASLESRGVVVQAHRSELLARCLCGVAGGSGTDIPLGRSPGRALHESCVRDNFC
jgi:hypothetical protein